MSVNTVCSWQQQRISALVSTVQDVVTLGAKKQMFRIDARSDIAFVQNAQSCRDRTVRQFPGDPMRANISNSIAVTHRDVAVASVGSAAGPQPTAVRLSDTRPKLIGTNH